MKTLAILGVLALVGGGVVGCYSHAKGVANRMEGKVEDFIQANGRPPNPEEVSALAAEADREERESRKADLDQAKQDAAAGVSALVTGSYITGAILIGGSILTWLGLGKKDKVKAPIPVPPSPPPAGGGVA